MSSIFASDNFMLKDFFNLTVAFLLMPLFIFTPGYVFGWLLDILSFRQRRGVTQSLISIVLSISIFPFITYILCRILPFSFAILLYGATWLIFFWIVINYRKKSFLPKNRWTWIACLLTLLWVLLGMLSLPDVQINQELFTNTISFDHQTRIALTDAIFRTGIPPVNPHIYPGKPLYTSYFYFWYIFPALLCKLTNGLIDARISFYAGILWVGIALRAAACLYLRFQAPENNRSIGLRSVAAVGLFFITGLDIIFASIYISRYPGNPFVTEWWNGNNLVQAWAGATLWVPHHIAGLVAGITGILIFQSIMNTISKSRRFLLATTTGVSLASMVGLSLYVTIFFVLFWCSYFIFSIIVKEWRNRIVWITITGVFSIIVSVPYLLELILNRQSFSTSGALLIFQVRQFDPVARLIFGQDPWLTNLFNFAFLPINYFLELGFFLLAGIVYFQSALKSQKNIINALLIDFLLLFSSIITCTFFKSTIIGNNDLGWRGFMPAQFILLVWSANVVVMTIRKRPGEKTGVNEFRPTKFIKNTLTALLVIGLASTLFDLSYLRWFSVINNLVGWGPNYPPEEEGVNWSKRNYALRLAYQFINMNYPISTIVQSNPTMENQIRALGSYGMRQTFVAGPEFSFIYGDSPDLYKKVSTQILPVFENPQINFNEVKNICKELKIDVLIIKDLDPIWKRKDSWVWKIKPSFMNEYIQMYDLN